MCRTNRIDQPLPLCAQLKHSPPAITVPDRADFLKLALEFLCQSLHFGEALVLSVAGHESAHVEGGALGGVGEEGGGDDFAAEEVREVDCCVGFGGELWVGG